MNAQAVKKKTASIPHSRIKTDIAAVLKRGGFIKDFDKKGKGVHKHITIELSYKKDLPPFHGFKRISSPGQRQYRGYRELFPVHSGFGMSIISTSHGVMSDAEARKNKLGGEILVNVW